MYMSNLWVTFSTDSSGSFTELSGNIIYNVNNIYNFNGNVIDTTSNFIIYELSNNPIQGHVSLEASNWKQLTLNNNLAPFQGYWLGGINTILPEITELLLISFYHGPLENSTYENDVTNTDGSIVSILRIIIVDKLLNPERLIGKYVDFTSQSGSNIEILEYISELLLDSGAHAYYFKISDTYNTEVTVVTMGETLNIPVITEQ